jgi:rod shape-determining protein MreB
MSNFIEKIQNIQIPFVSPLHVYFDFGTSKTRIAVKEKGVVFKEASYLGYNERTKEYLFFGNEAKTIHGKTPDFIKIVRPIVNGILSDFDAQVAYINNSMQKAVSPYIPQSFFIKSSIKGISAAPTTATEIEQRAVEEALIKSDCSSVIILEKAIATAAGCGFNIFSHHPHFIIDLGAGIIELSIISGGGIVSQKILQNAGEHMDKLISNYIYLKHGIILGDKTCEELKIELLNFNGEEKTATVRGKSLETGLPKSVKIKSSDVKESLITTFNQIIDTAKELIEVSPPEVADEVFKNGIALTGNLASIKGIDSFFSKELKIESYVAQHYADATVYGLMKLDKNQDNIHKLVGKTS